MVIVRNNRFRRYSLPVKLKGSLQTYLEKIALNNQGRGRDLAEQKMRVLKDLKAEVLFFKRTTRRVIIAADVILQE